jgi:hypothetical protein
MPTDPSMTDYAGDPDEFPETFRLITGATRGYADRLTAALEALANRTAYNRARIFDPPLVPLFGAQQTNYATVAGSGPGAVVPRFSPWPVSFTTPAPADFGRGGWVQSDVTDEGGLWWWVPIPNDVRITMVAASIRGDDGPGTNPGFPDAADRPKLRLYRQALDGSDVEPLLALGDETASQVEYEAHHTIPLDPGTPFLTPLELSGEYLVIEFVGHKGANVAPNTLKLYGIEITAEPAPAP